MVKIDCLEGHGPESIGPKLVEYFTPPTLQTPDGVIELEKESMIHTLNTLIDNYRTVLLIGDPGSGKSTLLRQLIHEYASQSYQAYDTVIDMPLRAFEASGQHSLLEWFSAKVAPNKPQNVLWVLDGLDEVREPEKIADMLDEIRASRLDDHLVVAARSVVAEEGLLPDYTPVTILPFDLNQIAACALAYYRTISTESAFDETRFREMVHRQILEKPWLKGIFSMPIMIPYVIRMAVSGISVLPDRRVDLYQELPDLLTEVSWAKIEPDSFVSVFALPRGITERSARERLDQAFQYRIPMNFYKYLAYKMTTDIGRPVITRAELEMIVGNYFQDEYSEIYAPIEDAERRTEAFLNAADKGLSLIVRLEEDGYGFVHRSFYEFFTAYDITTKKITVEETLEFLVQQNLLTSLHIRESIRFILEIFYEHGKIERIIAFLNQVMDYYAEEKDMGAMLASSFITEDIVIPDISKVLSRIYEILSNSIKDIGDSSRDIQAQRKLQRLEIHKDRLENIIRRRQIDMVL